MGEAQGTRYARQKEIDEKREGTRMAERDINNERN
jgi:hypothetical protein